MRQQMISRDVSTAHLRRALEIKEQIENLESELTALLGGSPARRRGRPPGRSNGRRTMSASARGRIAAAQRARWAKQKGSNGAAPVKKQKRKLSAAGRAAIIAATKA